VTALGLQYGHGFFETLRVDRGRILGLDEHLERLFASWRRFFRMETPDLTFESVIGQVIDGCGLGDTVAAVKLMAFLGKRNQVSVLVTARPYIHRLVALKKNGLDLVTCGSSRQSELAGHKSMNYQYYYLEGARARERGGDEALILNPDGSVSETNTANLLFVRDRSAVLPMSGHVLPGIMESRVKGLLMSWGYSVERRPVFPGELAGMGRVIATNALMGAVPVRSLDGVPLPEDDGLCGEINRHVLNPV
jgi:para-aminobenzoate synthetase component 1